MDPRNLRVIWTTYFSLLTHAKPVSLVTFCDTTAGIGSVKGQTGQDRITEGRTDMKSEIVM